MNMTHGSGAVLHAYVTGNMRALLSQRFVVLLICDCFVILFCVELIQAPTHIRLFILAHKSNSFIHIVSKSEPLFFFCVLIFDDYGLIMCIMHYTASWSDSVISIFGEFLWIHFLSVIYSKRCCKRVIIKSNNIWFLFLNLLRVLFFVFEIFASIVFVVSEIVASTLWWMLYSYM